VAADVQFFRDVPPDVAETYLLSGEQSRRIRDKVFVVVPGIVTPTDRKIAFELRSEYSRSPFNTALRFGKFLAVGHEKIFYLFDLEAKQHFLTINLDFPFVNMREDDGHLYVTSTQGIYCISQDGLLLWRNTSLGIDGVLIDHFEHDFVHGKGEWDPPDGWRKFTVRKLTGLEVDEVY
jgi:hypothetical protein